MVVLNIELTHEKGLDDKMILKSELFSKEILYSDKSITLQMKNGIEIVLNAKYNEDSEEFGPSSVFKINGQLKNVSLKDPKEGMFNVEARINEPTSISINTLSGQNITLIITPALK